MLDQWPKEKARLEKVRSKLLARQRARSVPAWKRVRIWLAVAAFVGFACAAPPVRDILGTLVTEGVAAAREIAYSVTAETPEAIFQQGWTDYRSGEYEAATQKAYSILGKKNVTDHTQANCWYLLGAVGWETGANDAALVNLRKAYEGAFIHSAWRAMIGQSKA